MFYQKIPLSLYMRPIKLVLKLVLPNTLFKTGLKPRPKNSATAKGGPQINHQSDLNRCAGGPQTSQSAHALLDDHGPPPRAIAP